MGLDDKINVATAYPDGLVKVWGWRKEDGHWRCYTASWERSI